MEEDKSIIKRAWSSTIAGIRRILFSSQGLPIFLTAFVLGILFVLFRMQGIELDYEFVDVKKRIDRANLESKTLNAQKARALSVKSLRMLAKKYRLSEPKDNQIIVIPDDV